MPRGVYARNPRSAADRLFDLLHPIPECGCWVFSGCLNKNGYGRFSVKTGKNILAHRAAYAAFVCDPAGAQVLHKCDVRSCCNPDHLYLGTHDENMRDMRSRGRAQVGVAHKSARLTPEVVREIRSSPDGCTKTARRYGVGVMTILDVRHRRTWAHID